VLQQAEELAAEAWGAAQPGELISETHVAYFRLGLEAGLFPMGQSDMELRTLRVVA
jgi:hypothetical protein